MHLKRRHLLATALALPAVRARSAETRTLHAGFQKGEAILLAARQNKVLEKALAPLGWSVEWTEFQFGPPLLEAMRVGSIVIGGVGDTPPIFAQAAHASLVYVAANGAGPQAILLPPGSQIKTIQDLKGKRIAFGRGSAAHNFLLMVLEKAALRYDQIQPVTLGPADAGAAFERGAIDAWSIWDPYFALFESHPGVRVLCTNKDIGEQNSFYMANRAFAEANPSIVRAVVDAYKATAAWDAQHKPEVAQLLSDATGLPEPVMRREVDRLPFTVMDMDPGLVQSQQRIADRFRAHGLIPVDITVNDAVWHANA